MKVLKCDVCKDEIEGLPYVVNVRKGDAEIGQFDLCTTCYQNGVNLGRGED